MRFHGGNAAAINDDLKSLLALSVLQSPCPIMITDSKGVIEYVNPMFAQLTGYDLHEVKGKTPRILKSSKTPLSVYEDLWNTILSGRLWHGEICNRKKTGEEFWESMAISSLKDAHGVITHFAAVWQDVTTRKKHDADELRQKEHFEKQSRTDELTGIYNRRYLFEELERELERACRYERPLSGMMIDVDNFKKMNDHYGHPTGDRILRTFAKVLQKSIRAMDILGRYGGDEFLIILPEAGIEKTRVVAERIRKNLREYQENVVGEFGIVTASIGLVSFKGNSLEDRSAFLEKVDKVLFLAKSAGKNTVVEG